MSRLLGATLCTLALAAVATPLSAQQQLEKPRKKTTRGAEAQTEQFAAFLALANDAEIQLARFALEHTDQPQVKQFAQRMIDDHTRSLEQLRKFMPALGTPQPVTTEGEQPVTTEAPGATDQRPDRTKLRERAQRHHGPMLKFAREACSHELELTKEMLGKLEGQDFDMGYLSQQTVVHTQMLAMLKTMQGHGSADFQQFVEESLTTVQEHRDQACKLADQLAEKEGSRSGARPAPAKEKLPTPRS